MFKKILVICVLIMGLITTVTAQSCGDVNLDGEITILDALMVAQRSVKLIDALPGEVLFPPPVPVITGAETGGVYTEAITLQWDDSEGTSDEINLTKDGIPVSYERGDSISEDGCYIFTVTRQKPRNGGKSGTRINFMIASWLPETKITTNVEEQGGELNVYFKKGVEFDGSFKPLYTIWMEDLNGRFVQNLFVGSTPATNMMRYTQTFRLRPSALPYWMHKACVEDPYKANDSVNSTGLFLALPAIDGGPIPTDLDAVSGATMYKDFQLTTGRKFEHLQHFRVLMEINKSYDGNDYYTSDFSDSPYYPDSMQPSLVYGVDIVPDSDQVFYEMTVIGAGHFAGIDGELYSAENHTTALNMVEKIIVQLK